MSMLKLQYKVSQILQSSCSRSHSHLLRDNFKPRHPESNWNWISQLIKFTLFIMARPSATRLDTNHGFIIYKTQTMENFSSLSSSQNKSKSRVSSIRSRDETYSKYNLDFESVLAFGGMRRKHKKSPKSADEPAEASNTDACKETRNSYVSSRSSSSARSSASSTLYDFQEYSDWTAFRAKYEDKHKGDHDPFICGGRYGPGRGYVEYRHRRDCDGSCHGICLGKWYPYYSNRTRI